MSKTVNPWIEQEGRTEKENAGAMFTYEPYGWTFRLRHKGPSVLRWQQAAAKTRMTSRFKALAERQSQPDYELTADDAKVDRELTVEMFVDGLLSGWGGVVDRKGKKLPASRENGILLFTTFPDLFVEANRFAENRKNYSPSSDELVAGDDPDAQEGNSEATSDLGSEESGEALH